MQRKFWRAEQFLLHLMSLILNCKKKKRKFYLCKKRFGGFKINPMSIKREFIGTVRTSVLLQILVIADEERREK